MKKNLGLRKSWWRWGCGSNKKDEQMDGHEVGIEIGLLEKALVQFTASIPLTLFVSTSGLKKEFKAKREIDPVFPCHPPPPPKKKHGRAWRHHLHYSPRHPALKLRRFGSTPAPRMRLESRTKPLPGLHPGWGVD